METVFAGDSTTWLVFHGEADLATRDTLHAHLDSASRLDATRCLHLHLGGLTFADARAVHDLSTFAAGARDRGSAVVSCDPSPLLRRVAGLLGVALALGVA